MIEFVRSNFFPLKNTLQSDSINKLIQKYLIHSDINKKFEILDISSTNKIKSNSIFFLNKEIDISIKNYEKILVITDSKKFMSQLMLKTNID